MAPQRPSSHLTALLLVLALTGCGTPPAASTATAAPTVTPIKTACSNPLFPVVNGAQWVYNLSGSSTGSLTRSITSARPEGFSDRYVYSDGSTRTGDWTCEQGALSSLNPVESLSALIQSEDFSADYKTISTSGVTLPAILTPGTTWSQDVTFEGTQTISGQDAPGNGKATYSCKAADTETVSVPAGVFDAVRVGCQINGNVTVTLLLVGLPVELTASVTMWYARAVGMVKTENEIGGIGHSTIELASYTIP